MESVDFDDLFGPDEAIEDNRYNNETEYDGNGENQKKPVKVKNVVRNPQPKLDSERLVSDKGLPRLRNMFKEIDFKGKSHEAEDLEKLLSTLEHWGHCMFPQLQFTDLLQRIEKLGCKKPVQVCLNKIRLEMPLTDEDFVSGNNANDEIRREGDIDTFDTLLDADASSSNHEHTNKRKDLTDEQRETMARNKKIAEERRKARLAKQDVKIDDVNEDHESLLNSVDHECTEEELMSMFDDEIG